MGNTDISAGISELDQLGQVRPDLLLAAPLGVVVEDGVRKIGLKSEDFLFVNNRGNLDLRVGEGIEKLAQSPRSIVARSQVDRAMLNSIAEQASSRYPSDVVRTGDSRLPTISGEPYFADAVRGKTLSYRTVPYDGASLVLAVAGYLNFPGGVAMAVGVGWPVPYDVTICELFATKGLAAGALTLEARVAGAAVAAITIGAGAQVASNVAINVDVAAGATIEFYATAAVAVGCSIKAICRRRI